MVEVTDSSSVSTTEKSSQKCEDFLFLRNLLFYHIKKKSTPAKTGRGDKRQMNNMDIADYPKK